MGLAKFYTNKVVLITGGSMGIGKEVAKQALHLGAKVIITGRSIERLKKTEKEFSDYQNNIMIFQGDVKDFESNQRLIIACIERFGKLDVVIANAGLSCFGNIEEMDFNVAREIIDANIYGSLFPAKVAISELKKTSGSILFISSIAGFYGLPGYSPYSISKMALKGLAQSLQVELIESGIGVGIAYLGFTENEKSKRTLSPEGKWVDVPERNRFVRVSRRCTADKILLQIKNRKFSETHTIIGKLMGVITCFFPGLISFIMKFNYRRRKPVKKIGMLYNSKKGRLSLNKKV